MKKKFIEIKEEAAVTTSHAKLRERLLFCFVENIMVIITPSGHFYPRRAYHHDATQQLVSEQNERGYAQDLC